VHDTIYDRSDKAGMCPRNRDRFTLGLALDAYANWKKTHSIPQTVAITGFNFAGSVVGAEGGAECALRSALLPSAAPLLVA